MTNLKPCPFCGSRAKYAAGQDVPGFVIGCTNEKCHEFILQQMVHYDEAMEAVAAWNNRAERTCQRVNKPDQFFADNLEYSVDAYRCSVCNFRLDRITNYCPNCGAKVIDKVVEK